eukprot:TRINITY_DN8999_c0_g1_i1.p1 TRINITY_DN8999_c0_g1~~TRINITY_DN8999_c0_g1_i1.p1  ORF type:complete len:373 (+),score=54.29 TRINITY_DN8999_c0_g1_i1:156-1274(+)
MTSFQQSTVASEDDAPAIPSTAASTSSDRRYATGVLYFSSDSEYDSPPEQPPRQHLCVCGDATDTAVMVSCSGCRRRYHADCVDNGPNVLIDDVFYRFVCSYCTEGDEVLDRTALEWPQTVLLAIRQLDKRPNSYGCTFDQLLEYMKFNFRTVCAGKQNFADFRALAAVIEKNVNLLMKIRWLRPALLETGGYTTHHLNSQQFVDLVNLAGSTANLAFAQRFLLAPPARCFCETCHRALPAVVDSLECTECHDVMCSECFFSLQMDWNKALNSPHYLCGLCIGPICAADRAPAHEPIQLRAVHPKRTRRRKSVRKPVQQRAKRSTADTHADPNYDSPPYKLPAEYKGLRLTDGNDVPWAGEDGTTPDCAGYS